MAEIILQRQTPRCPNNHPSPLNAPSIPTAQHPLALFLKLNNNNDDQSKIVVSHLNITFITEIGSYISLENGGKNTPRNNDDVTDL